MKRRKYHFSILIRLPLRGNDRYDQQILTNSSQPVIWAIGPVNSKGEVSYHSKRVRGDLKLDFGRIPQWNCPLAGKKATVGRIGIWRLDQV